jgi:ribosome-associated toxin RatA of RatAB toxin-antitoxin module
MKLVANRVARILGALFGTFVFLFNAMPLDARSVDPAMELRQKLDRGEIIVGLKNVGESKYVTGSIVINEPPDQVWPIVSNPFEFKGRISPRMKEVQMMVDKHERSVMRVEMDVVLIPHFNYVVESLYENSEKIEFHRVSGTLKDFKGAWEMKPLENGKTELSYSMFMDPGFFVPQWIMREGVKSELPHILEAVRKRVMAVSRDKAKPETQTIVAATFVHHHANIAANSPVFE